MASDMGVEPILGLTEAAQSPRLRYQGRPERSLLFIMAQWVEGSLVTESNRGRVNLEKQQEEIERLRAEMSAKPLAGRRISTRAVARILDDVHLEGRMGKFLVYADEPISRGGTEQGASPLQYFMVGVAF
jgi:hypothetical protein